MHYLDDYLGGDKTISSCKVECLGLTAKSLAKSSWADNTLQTYSSACIWEFP